MDKPTTVAASVLRVDNEMDKMARTVAATSFSRLPRELRDEIYDLLVLDEVCLDCEITLTADGQPQRTVRADRNGRAFLNSPFEIEYVAAVERRIKKLLAGGDDGGLQLSQTGAPADVLRSKETYVKAEGTWLEVSRGQHASGQISHNFHALVLVIPLYPVYDRLETLESKDDKMRLNPAVRFKFKFAEKAELGPRLRVGCYWDGYLEVEWHGDVAVTPKKRALHISSDHDGSVLQQVLNVAKEMNWKGSAREYMLWQRYIVSNVRRNKQASEE